MSVSVNTGTYTRTNSFGGGVDTTVPRFHIESIPDPIASAREGRPIFRDRLEIELITPGNPYNIPNEIVNEGHKQRFPREYEAYMKGIEISPDGTPLEQWPLLRPGQVKELKGMDFSTVEQVANMSDHATQRFMGGMRIRDLARAYLDEAAHSAALSKATADNEHKDSQIAELTHKVEELSVLLNMVHEQMQQLRDAPSPIATAVPFMSDPVAMSRPTVSDPRMNVGSSLSGMNEPLSNLPNVESSLSNLPEVRRGPGRPRKEVTA
jgi:hypothetical protein